MSRRFLADGCTVLTRLGPGRESIFIVFLQASLLGVAYFMLRPGRWAVAGETGMLGLPWMGALLGAAALGGIGWLMTWRRYRIIFDTPTSRIASAAQGYTELVGRAEPLPGTTLLSPMTQLPCLWYRFTLYRKRNDRWQLEESGESDLSFLLNDGSGVCEINPVGAEIHTAHRESRLVGEHRYTEEVLLKEDRLYVLGDFGSQGGSHLALDPRKDVDALLTQWKSDQERLHARFDMNGDRRIDDAEWRQVVDAAKKEVEVAHRQARLSGVQHRINKPNRRGYPYLLTNLAPEGLAARYRRWSWLHMATTLGVMAVLINTFRT